MKAFGAILRTGGSALALWAALVPASPAPAQDGPAPAQGTPAPAQDNALIRGVNTHFAQGWPPRLLGTARDLGATMIRDSVHWPLVEKTRGHYEFTAANSGHIDRACAAGMKVLLVEGERNPLYDGRQTVHSPAGRAAYAAFLGALAGRWPGCVAAIEVGNEINGKGGMIGPAAQDRIGSHIALLRAVRSAVKPAHPGVALLGGSVNTVAGGFLVRLVRAGALPLVDGLAIHPYRPDPEGVDREIARLRAAMRAAGGEKPLWATEFSREFPEAAAAAPFYLKMAALLESAGVTRHLWYALADQKGFPTMGLTRFDGSPKPGGAAFRFAARSLSPLGPARRIDEGDPALFHFRYGTDAHVIWGAPRSLAAEGAQARLFRADGTPASPAAGVGDEPLVILGASAVRIGPARVLADSLYAHGQQPLGWAASRSGGGEAALAPVDWEWTSYLGIAGQGAAVVNLQGMAIPAGGSITVHYRAGAAAPLFASACINGLRAGTVRAAIRHNGRTVWSAAPGPADTGMTVNLPLPRVATGDRVDLVLASAGSMAARLRYRWRLSLDSATPAPCPEDRQS